MSRLETTILVRSPPPDLPHFEDIVQASQRLSNVAHHTPVFTSKTLDSLVRAHVFLKCENFQRTGAFKFRGAYNTLCQFSQADKARGVITYSSGNHAQAIALAGQLLNISATIVMPNNAPAVKLAATKGYGAEIVLYDPAVTAREELGQQLAAERGMILVPPYDHPQVIAGQGTAAKELFEKAGPLDTLMVCCGGGGLLSGSALTTRALAPNARVVGVEPALADDATRSFQSGTLQTVTNPPTIADGARTPYLGAYTFPLVLQFVDEMVTVSEDAIREAMRFLWERMKLVVEPTGAVALAALLEGLLDVHNQRVGVILTGGNVDLGVLHTFFNS